MPVDYQQLNDIHRIEGEVDQARAGVKALIEQRTSLIEGLPEYQALEAAWTALEAAKAKFKIAVRDNREVAKLDVDSNIRTATRFNVRSIPAVLFFKNGKLVDQVIGAVPKPALESKFKQHAAA